MSRLLLWVIVCLLVNCNTVFWNRPMSRNAVWWCWHVSCRQYWVIVSVVCHSWQCYTAYNFLLSSYWDNCVFVTLLNVWIHPFVNSLSIHSLLCCIKSYIYKLADHFSVQSSVEGGCSLLLPVQLCTQTQFDQLMAAMQKQVVRMKRELSDDREAADEHLVKKMCLVKGEQFTKKSNEETM